MSRVGKTFFSRVVQLLIRLMDVGPGRVASEDRLRLPEGYVQPLPNQVQRLDWGRVCGTEVRKLAIQFGVQRQRLGPHMRPAS